ncbi:hypothetical protein NE865_00214 [Phthorimaea operculella]|nr:hypothetical protein NE865_00214 [Phthorimaea operculella]
MSAHEQMRAMLDQLMGTARNGETDKHGVKFYDDVVCKSFLLQCCPHEILSSTRMDLGECPKIHDLALRADFELASKTKDYFYDIDATEHLEAFIADCDRRTSAAKQRLAETQEELSQEVTEKANAVHELAEQIGQKLARAEALGEEGMVEESIKLMGEEVTEKANAVHELAEQIGQKLARAEALGEEGMVEESIKLMGEIGQKLACLKALGEDGMVEESIKLMGEKANAVHELAEQIGKKLARAEALGEEGMVEESIKLMGEIDELRKKKAVAEQEYRNSMPASSYQQQKLRVCEVCSAYLGIHDNDRRLADHFGGKLHLGFITIREKLAELQKTVDKRREERGEKERERGSSRRHYVGGRELDRRARRHRETARDRGDRDRERKEGDRDRERKDRDRERDRKETQDNVT